MTIEIREFADWYGAAYMVRSSNISFQCLSFRAMFMKFKQANYSARVNDAEQIDSSGYTHCRRPNAEMPQQMMFGRKDVLQPGTASPTCCFFYFFVA